jgi:replicative DNA helicase
MTTRTAPAAWTRSGGQKISNRAGSDPAPSVSQRGASPTLDAEAAFLGAVLHLPAPVALEALEPITAEDFADPRLSILADVCRQLAVDGVAPDPVAVLAYVRRNAVMTGVEAVHGVTLLIDETYGGCPLPASVGWYRLAVLDAALRRRCAELAARIGQAADHDSLDSLIELVDAEASAVQALRNRRAASEGGSL